MTLAPFCLVSHDVEEFRFHVAMGKRTIGIVAAIQKVILVARARWYVFVSLKRFVRRWGSICINPTSIFVNWYPTGGIFACFREKFCIALFATGDRQVLWRRFAPWIERGFTNFDFEPFRHVWFRTRSTESTGSLKTDQFKFGAASTRRDITLKKCVQTGLSGSIEGNGRSSMDVDMNTEGSSFRDNPSPSYSEFVLVAFIRVMRLVSSRYGANIDT